MGQRGDGGTWPCPVRPLSEDSCVVSLFPCLIMFFSFPQRRLKIDPAGRAVPGGTGAYTVWVRVRTLVRRLVRLRVWVFGEVPAEENEVSERGFKLTPAGVDCAAAVGQRKRYVSFGIVQGFLVVRRSSNMSSAHIMYVSSSSFRWHCASSCLPEPSAR